MYLAPTGDAPTTSERSTIQLPTKVRLILETWRYVPFCPLPLWCLGHNNLTHDYTVHRCISSLKKVNCFFLYCASWSFPPFSVWWLLPGLSQRSSSGGYRSPQHPQYVWRFQSVGWKSWTEETEEGGEGSKKGERQRILEFQYEFDGFVFCYTRYGGTSLYRPTLCIKTTFQSGLNPWGAQILFNSLTPRGYDCNLELVILYWAFPVKFVWGDCHKTSLLISQHWFR